MGGKKGKQTIENDGNIGRTDLCNCLCGQRNECKCTRVDETRCENLKTCETRCENDCFQMETTSYTHVDVRVTGAIEYNNEI